MKDNRTYHNNFKKTIESKQEKMVKARNEGKKQTFIWLGMLGIVGWSVTIPLLLGIALGQWIDKTYPSRFSFTLMFLFGGLILGCFIAFYWVKKMLNKKK